MYVGIGPEQGKRIPDRDSFEYACKGCQYGSVEEKDTFWMLAKDCNTFEEFIKELVEWFYSGNWRYDECDKEENWIIRFSNGGLRDYYGTYANAVNSARQEAVRKQVGFVVN